MVLQNQDLCPNPCLWGILHFWNMRVFQACPVNKLPEFFPSPILMFRFNQYLLWSFCDMKLLTKSNFSLWWAFNKYVSSTKWRLFVTWIYFRSKQIKLAFLKRRWGRERVSFTCSFSWSDTQTWKKSVFGRWIDEPHDVTLSIITIPFPFYTKALSSSYLSSKFLIR